MYGLLLRFLFNNSFGKFWIPLIGCIHFQLAKIKYLLVYFHWINLSFYSLLTTLQFSILKVIYIFISPFENKVTNQTKLLSLPHSVGLDTIDLQIHCTFLLCVCILIQLPSFVLFFVWKLRLTILKAAQLDQSKPRFGLEDITSIQQTLQFPITFRQAVRRIRTQTILQWGGGLGDYWARMVWM